jgi:hypothetical protein
MISIIVGVASRFMAPSSWLFTSCSNYYNYFEILLNMKFKDNHKAPAGCHNTIMIISYIFIITSWPYHTTKPCKNKLDVCNIPNFQKKKQRKMNFPISKIWNQQKLLLNLVWCIVIMLIGCVISMIDCWSILK